MPKGVFVRTEHHKKMCAINSPYKKGVMPWHFGSGRFVDIKCGTCGKVFNVEYKERDRKFCSQECYGKTRKGRTRSEEARKLFSENRRIAWTRPDVREKHLNSAKKLWENVEFRNKMEMASIKSNWGHFFSKKNNANLYYASKQGELTAYLKLEEDDSVVEYGRCNFSIPFFFGGMARLYRPDILVKKTDGSITIIEVKPKWAINHPNTRPKIMAKFEALRSYCEKNGYDCEIWSEDKYL
jgi:hypothetical protein